MCARAETNFGSAREALRFEVFDYSTIRLDGVACYFDGPAVISIYSSTEISENPFKCMSPRIPTLFGGINSIALVLRSFIRRISHFHVSVTFTGHHQCVNFANNYSYNNSVIILRGGGVLFLNTTSSFN